MAGKSGAAPMAPARMKSHSETMLGEVEQRRVVMWWWVATVVMVVVCPSHLLIQERASMKKCR